MFKKDVSGKWKRKFPVCCLHWDKAGKGEPRPWIGESLLLKCWSEEEEWLQRGRWLRLPMARIDALPSNSPEEIFLSTQKKWNKSRNALKPSGHTGQRKILFTNCLEYHCLLADLVFIFYFQCYLVLVCFPAKPNVINWQGFGVLIFEDDGAVSQNSDQHKGLFHRQQRLETNHCLKLS